MSLTDPPPLPLLDIKWLNDTLTVPVYITCHLPHVLKGHISNDERLIIERNVIP